MYMISTPIHESQFTGVAVGKGLVTPDPEKTEDPVPVPLDPAPPDAEEGPPPIMVPLLDPDGPV